MLKFHSPSLAQGVPSVAPKQLKTELSGDTPPLVLDVRETDELAISRLSGATHLPLGQLGERFGELDQDRDIVVLCRSGARSAEATKFLLRQGFRSVRNVSGGINAWAREVDPSLPVY